MPCTPKRARLLLERKKAAVFKLYPFTIILNERENGENQPVELKIDPGSKTSGIALAVSGKGGIKVVAAFHLEHRGHAIKKRLEQRRGVRRGRRNRHTRHRKARFLNRKRPDGWLPPSLKSRVFNIETWARRFTKVIHVSRCAVETVRFDMQKMANPEILGTQYQQGELLGYEVREYLLEKWGRKCAYCDKEGVPLQVEHICPRSNGGSNRVSNLTLACEKCNIQKGVLDVRNFLKKDETRLQKILSKAKAPLKDAAAVNATRFATGNALKALGLPTTFWSGGRTKKNRVAQGYKKDHWIDAACVGESGAKVAMPLNLKCRILKATGHGERQVCLVSKHGFPRSQAASGKIFFGFKTGDIAQAHVVAGKKKGIYIGKVAVRATGSFNISTKNGVVQGLSFKTFRKLHSADGYSYPF